VKEGKERIFMDIKEIVDNLDLISSVIPDYVESRNRGLTDEESEKIAFEAISEAIEALEKQAFLENTVIDDISDWFVDYKDCLLDAAKKVSIQRFKEWNKEGVIDEIDLDNIIEDVVDEIQKGILNVLSTFKD